jgi:hypothetical protein
MFGMKRISIAQNERGLKLRSQSFDAVLEPGVYHFFDPFEQIEVQLYDVGVPEFKHPCAEVFVKEAREKIEQHFMIVQLGDREVGVVFKNGRLTGVLAPGKLQLYWLGHIEVRVERLDITKDIEEWRSKMTCSARRAGSIGRDGKRYVRPVDALLPTLLGERRAPQGTLGV